MVIQNCRLCDSVNIKKVVDLGYHPLADTFLPEDLLYGPEVSYPLNLGLCGDCGHVFTLYAVKPEDRYQKTDYSYDSSNSNVSIEHFREFAEAVIAEREIESDGLIVDIGSNVGTLLAHFQSLGYANVLGVEPSRNIADIAVNGGVPTINDFFCERVTEKILIEGPVKVLLSANVLNHADDLRSLLRTAKSVLSDNGIFVFEVPYLLDLVKNTSFDTIYHEHVHYHSIKPLAKVLQASGFSIFKIEHTDYMCGSIRVYAELHGSHSKIVNDMIKNEVDFHLFELPTYEAFMTRVQNLKLKVLNQLVKIRTEGGKIIGIGAATKGNTFLNYCRLDSDTIAYISDASKLKIGKLTPGSHIKIVGDSEIDSSITHAIILPWNIAPMLVAKLAHLGLQFYVPQVE